jgi:hypothetical protein
VPQVALQVLPAPQVHQVPVLIIFPVARVVATSPVPRFLALVFLVPPLVAVDLVVPVVAVPVGVVAAELVLSSARAAPSVVRRLKS